MPIEIEDNLTPDEQALMKAYEEGKEITEEIPTEEAPKEEIKEEVKEEVKEDRNRFVPHEAFHEERMRRKEIQQKYYELQEKFARADERIKAIAERMAPQESVPDKEEDPLGHARYEQEQIRKQLEDSKRALEEKTQRLHEDMETMKLRTFIEAQERQFTSKNTDYVEAINHLVSTRASILEELGLPKEEAIVRSQHELGDLATKAIEAGRNPAEVAYNMAKKMGFAAKAKEIEQIKTIQKGMDAAKSLSDAGGKQLSGELTAEALAEMSDDEFAKLSDEQFRRAFGG